MRALEDLRIQVRSPRSRRYVDEAISAYNASAYRSSIIAIWIAITSDLIDKIRDMADESDGHAIKLKATLDRAIEAKDKIALQKFENALLDEARDNLQLIGSDEHLELNRIKEDRNLCAHPAFVSDDELFNPTPERIRDHLSTAVDSLLSHGPIRGRKMLDRFEEYVLSASFPMNDAELSKTLLASYINRSTPRLRSSLAAVVCKSTLDDDNHDMAERRRYTRVAKAFAILIPLEFDEALRGVIEKRQDSLDDEGLFLLIGGLCHLSSTWDYLHDGIKVRVEVLIKKADVEDLLVQRRVMVPLPASPVAEMLLDRMSEVGGGENLKSTLRKKLRTWPDRRLIFKFIDLLANAASYYSAEFSMSGLVALSAAITADDLTEVLRTFNANDQARRSTLGVRQLSALRRKTESISEEFAAVWEAFDLAEAEEPGESESI